MMHQLKRFVAYLKATTKHCLNSYRLMFDNNDDGGGGRDDNGDDHDDDDNRNNVEVPLLAGVIQKLHKVDSQY